MARTYHEDCRECTLPIGGRGLSQQGPLCAGKGKAVGGDCAEIDLKKKKKKKKKARNELKKRFRIIIPSYLCFLYARALI